MSTLTPLLLGLTVWIIWTVGYAIMTMMNTTQTLLVDLLPDQSGAVTACVCFLPFSSVLLRIQFMNARFFHVQNNLVRCSFGAVCVSVVDLIIKAVGVGWTYVILAATCVAVAPIMFIVLRVGPRCRARRRVKAGSS